MKILTIANKKDEKILRTKVANFDFNKIAKPREINMKDAEPRENNGAKPREINILTKKEINDLIKEMKKTMIEASGIGLSANQLGLNIRLFIAQLSRDYTENQFQEVRLPKISRQCLGSRTSPTLNFYAIFNPKIKVSPFSRKKTKMEEGCLSVPGVFGIVERPERITLIGQDINGKKIKIKAAGLLARVFQHETDHLNGILFIDKCDKLYAINSKFQAPNDK